MVLYTPITASREEKHWRVHKHIRLGGFGVVFSAWLRKWVTEVVGGKDAAVEGVRRLRRWQQVAHLGRIEHETRPESDHTAAIEFPCQRGFDAAASRLSIAKTTVRG